MSSAPQVEPFTGKDWEECDSFIRALRFRALWEGKQRDPAWIADLAAPYFSRKALLWHCRLPQDVREDWFKLQIALLEQWAPPDEVGMQIEPTPAAAPSISRMNEAERPLAGVLQFVLAGSNHDYYVKSHQDGVCRLTNHLMEALRIRCYSLSNTTLLERIDGPVHSWLAIHWGDKFPHFGKGSTAFAYLTLVDSKSLKSSFVEDQGTPSQLMACMVSTNREVVPVWEKDDTSKVTLVPFSNGDSGIWLAADPNAYSNSNPNEIRGKLMIATIA